MKKLFFWFFSWFFGPKKTQGATFRSSSGSEILEMFKSFDKNALSQRSGGVGSSSWAWFCIIRVLQVDWSAPQRDGKPLDRVFGSCVFYFPKMKTRGIWPIEILWFIIIIYAISMLTWKILYGCGMCSAGGTHDRGALRSELYATKSGRCRTV